MAEVTSMYERNGEETFVMCPCQDDGTMVTPVVIHDPKGPIIVSLMCPECETVLPVDNGIVQMGGE